MIKGQCLCGEIQYVYHADINDSILCFCQDCRKAQGALFGWNSPIEKMYFQVLRGEEFLKEFFHTPNKARVFCMQCASPIYSYRLDLPNIFRLRLGTVVEGNLPSPKQAFYTQYQPEFINIINCTSE